jgi:hypothetical protein
MNDYFPPEYKQFPFSAGDLLANRHSNGQFAVNKVLKVDKIVVEKGGTINIQGTTFTAPVTDFLLIVSASYGEADFDSLDDARLAALSGKWRIRIGHVPNRAPGAAAGQIKIGSAAVAEAELDGYRAWRRAFDEGEAGVF